MIKRLVLTLIPVLLVGCSTVERRTYYEPLADPSKISGPAEPSCGWTNFGGAPDQYVATFTESPVKVTANQSIQPYLFGPWFASVLPVFPVTWLVEAFVNHDLEVQLSSSKPVLRPLAAMSRSVLNEVGVTARGWSCYATFR